MKLQEKEMYFNSPRQSIGGFIPIWIGAFWRIIIRGLPGFWRNYWRGSPRAALLALFFISVSLVLPLAVCPIFLHFDLGWSLHAGHRWAAGQGLTIAAISGEIDVSFPTTSQPLVRQAPLLSIVAGLIIQAGLPLGLVFKLIYALTFLLGWAGWGAIALPIIRRSIRWNSRRLPLNSLLLTISPIFFSPYLTNSDIFLWCSMPYVLLLMASETRPVYFGFWAGALAAVSYLFRFASAIFVPLVATFFLVDFLSGKSVFQRALAFTAGFALVVAPEFFYLTNVGRGPHVISSSPMHGEFSKFIGSCSLSFVGCTGLTFLEKTLREYSIVHPTISFFLGVLVFLLWFALPHVIWENTPSFETKTRRLLGFLAILPLIHTIFLFICQASIVVGDWDYIGNQRYYWSAGITFPLCLYSLAAQNTWRSAARVSVFLLCLYIAFFIVVRGTDRFDPCVRQFVVPLKTIIGVQAAPMEFPLSGFSSGYDRTARLVRGLLENNPEAICLASPKPAFDADGFDRIREIPTEAFLKTMTCTKACRLFIAGPAAGAGISDVWGNGGMIELLEKVPNRKTIATVPEEGTRILMIDLPASYSFTGR